MKRMMFALMAGCVILLGSEVSALTITPTSGALGSTRLEGTLNDLNETHTPDGWPFPNAVGFAANAFLYKMDVGASGDVGALAASYETSFSPATQPSGATITYVGGEFVSPTATNPAWLFVKDGNQNPAWYLFDLYALTWNGKDALVLTGFWPGNGSISHVSLYGTTGPDTPVPEPGTMVLLGSGLLGLSGAARKRARK